jgi:hypothetical protein
MTRHDALLWLVFGMFLFWGIGAGCQIETAIWRARWKAISVVALVLCWLGAFVVGLW